jgi:hypothetical protein
LRWGYAFLGQALACPFLIARAVREGCLPAGEEARLRRLMSRHNHAAPELSWDVLIDAGLFMTGVWNTILPGSIDVTA